jgi:hypothetical protein
VLTRRLDQEELADDLRLAMVARYRAVVTGLQEGQP